MGGERGHRLRPRPRRLHRPGRVQLRQQPGPRPEPQPRRLRDLRAPSQRRRGLSAGPPPAARPCVHLRAREQGDVHQHRHAVRAQCGERPGRPPGGPDRRLPVLSPGFPGRQGTSGRGGIWRRVAPVTAGTSAARLRWYMVGTYVLASVAAVAVTFALVALGLEFSLRQWLLFLIIASFVIPLYVLPDVYMIVRHLRPITAVLQVVDRGGRPGTKEVSRAIVRALNLPFFSFVRVTLFHGPMASIGAALGLVIANRVADGDFAPWQIVGLALTIFLFASPAHAISEFFVIAKKVIPQVERLWVYCDRVEDD